VAPEEGVVFNGSTLSGPTPGPFGSAEGDVFNGVSLPGDSGGSSGSGGLGLGYGTNPPASPFPVVPTPSGGPLVLTAMTPGPTAVFTPYMQYNAASGGTPPYSWELIGGALPLGTDQKILSTNGVLDQIYGNFLLQTGPFSYTLQVTDSSGVVSLAYIGNDTYASNPITTFSGGSLSTTNDNQLAILVFVSSNESAASAVAQITSVTTNGNVLTFTRVFHDESFTFSDSAGDSGAPVATISVDIFTAPVPTQISSLGWTAHGNGNVAHGTVMRFTVNGLADINHPFDPAFPNVAKNLTGTASAPTNTGITTSNPGGLLFGITINHTTGGGVDTTPVPDPTGWVPIPGGTQDNSGGSSGFSLMASNKEAPTVLNNITVTDGFTDNFWYQVIFAFIGSPGGSQQVATATITGDVTPVMPGTVTFDGPTGDGSGNLITGSGTGAYFIVPPYNILMIEMFAGTDGPTTLASTLGARFSSEGSETTIILTPSDPGAPIIGGPMQYAIGGGSPAGHITFTWS
jgi:hypothetical protein